MQSHIHAVHPTRQFLKADVEHYDGTYIISSQVWSQ